MKNEIFLGKNGKCFGPFELEQIERMKAAEELAGYAFIWDGRDAQPCWRSLETAPPPPPGYDVVAVEDFARSAPVAPARKIAPVLARELPGLEALCHDSHNVVVGRLAQVTEAGCELVCANEGAPSGFGARAKIVLNLLDPKSGRAMNVAARLGGIGRRQGEWRLQVLWDSCPELVERQLENAS